ncbi:hypothetical protein A3715_18185 [Oleiphilus sp. HI0009]|nr:hypothetical protein A3715_18185 [Oleiphilus sp. HI0009]
MNHFFNYCLFDLKLFYSRTRIFLIGYAVVFLLSCASAFFYTPAPSLSTNEKPVPSIGFIGSCIECPKQVLTYNALFYGTKDLLLEALRNNEIQFGIKSELNGLDLIERLSSGFSDISSISILASDRDSVLLAIDDGVFDISILDTNVDLKYVSRTKNNTIQLTFSAWILLSALLFFPTRFADLIGDDIKQSRLFEIYIRDQQLYLYFYSKAFVITLASLFFYLSIPLLVLSHISIISFLGTETSELASSIYKLVFSAEMLGLFISFLFFFISFSVIISLTIFYLGNTIYFQYLSSLMVVCFIFLPILFSNPTAPMINVFDAVKSIILGNSVDLGYLVLSNTLLFLTVLMASFVLVRIFPHYKTR